MPTSLSHIILAFAAVQTLAIAATPASAAPRESAKPVSFAQFPAKLYSGPKVLPDFKGKQRQFKDMRTSLTRGFRGKPNFAGSWRVIDIGCGTRCAVIYLGDLATGTVLETSLGGEEHGALHLQHRPNSRLIIATWEEDFDGEVCISQGFVLDAAGLRPATAQRKGQCPP